ncbi:MAG: hypothetical protein WCD37_14695 [Chloroflexia bacterium]
MEIKTQRQKVLKRTLLVMLLAGSTIAGSVVVPALQSNSVQVTYASDCEGVRPDPDLDCPNGPTPTPTPTPNSGP